MEKLLEKLDTLKNKNQIIFLVAVVTFLLLFVLALSLQNIQVEDSVKEKSYKERIEEAKEMVASGNTLIERGRALTVSGERLKEEVIEDVYKQAYGSGIIKNNLNSNQK